MIDITFQPTQLVIDQINSLSIKLTNSGDKPYTHVNFRLHLPSQIVLLEGTDKIENAKIDPGQNIVLTVRVRPKQVGSWILSSSSFSYRDSQGQSHHPTALQQELIAIPMATISKSPEAVVKTPTILLPVNESNQIKDEVLNPSDITTKHHELKNSQPAEIHHENDLRFEKTHVPVPKIFISYSHIDEKYMTRLVSMLKPLERQGAFQIWHDREITAGNEWYQDIQHAINTCDLALLLVSIDFLNSRFIQEDELPRLLQLCKERGLRVIPIIVRHCTWTSVPVLKDLQALPKDGKPVISFRGAGQPDRVWTDIVKSIQELIVKS